MRTRLDVASATALLAGMLVFVACGENLGPAQSSRGQLAIVLAFNDTGDTLALVRSVHATALRDNGATVAADTSVAVAGTEDSVKITLSVDLTGSSESFTIRLALLGAAGDTLFSGETTATASDGAVVPVKVPLSYVGVGATAVRVVATPSNVAVPAVASVTLTAAALDAAGDTLAGTPILWRTSDPDVASFPDRRVGTLVATSGVGAVLAIAQLLTGSADTVAVLVVESNAGLVQAAIDSLEAALFVLFDQGVEDSLGTRGTAADWTVVGQTSFAVARQFFEQALAAEPGNQHAAFGLAWATAMGVFEDAGLRTYLEAWDQWGSQYGDNPFQSAGPYPPLLADAQPVLQNVVKPALADALALLDTVDSTAFTFSITARMRGELPAELATRELDLTDVYFLRAAVRAVLGGIDVVLSYDLSPSPYGPTGFDQALAPASNFLSLNGDAATLLPEAKQHFASATSIALQAFDLLEAETDDQSDDLVRYDGTGTMCCFNGLGDLFDTPLAPSNVTDARRVLTEVGGALQGPYTVSEAFGPEGTVDLVVDASRFFLSALDDLKAFLPSYTTQNGTLRWAALGYDDWLFPDPTFGAILPGIPSTDSLKNTLDIASVYRDIANDIDTWWTITQGPSDGRMFAMTLNGDLWEMAQDFSSQTDRPDVAEYGPTLSRNVANGELVVLTQYGNLSTRPDDANSSWTLRLQMNTSPWHLARNAANGNLFALSDYGELWEIASDYSTVSDRPDIYYYTPGFAVNDSTGELVALGDDGLVFARSMTDTLATWTQRLALPTLNYNWSSLVQSPTSPALFAVTASGDLYEIDGGLTAASVRPRVPVGSPYYYYGMQLTANQATGELVLLVRDGRVFTRPPDAATAWTLRTTLPRTVVN